MNEVDTRKKAEFIIICRRIMADPRKFWEQEPTDEEDVLSLYKRFGFLIIGIPFIFGVVGLTLSGKLSSTLLNSLVSGFMLSLCVSYIMSWIMHWLSPKFGGEKNLTGALKLNLYSQVPAVAMAIASLLGLGIISYILELVGSIWCIVITYLGVPKMLGIPREKLIPFILTTCAVMIAISSISGALMIALHLNLGL